MNKKSGFSLVEVLVVIAIIGILAALAVPNYINWLPKYRAKRAAMELSGQLHQVKLTAVKENRTIGVFFHAATDRYYILQNSGTNGNWDGPTVAGGDDPTERFVDLNEYGSGVQYAAAPPLPAGVLEFTSVGTCRSSSPIGPIRITNINGNPIYQVQTTLAGAILLDQI